MTYALQMSLDTLYHAKRVIQMESIMEMHVQLVMLVSAISSLEIALKITTFILSRIKIKS